MVIPYYIAGAGVSVVAAVAAAAVRYYYTSPPTVTLPVVEQDSTLPQEETNTLNIPEFPSATIFMAPAEALSLSGKKLMSDILTSFSDISEKESDIERDKAALKETLHNRFIETIYGENSKRNEDQDTNLKGLIDKAVDKLYKETKELNSISSVEKATQERHMLNIFGHIYDFVGSLCHKVAVAYSAENKTAADLFKEVGNHAQGIKQELNNEIAKKQVELDLGLKASLAGVTVATDVNKVATPSSVLRGPERKTEIHEK